jgi:hypothetical protein
VTQADDSRLRSPKEAKPARRDWIVLPLISLLTISIMAGSLELIGRRTFRTSNTSVASCIDRDPSAGSEGIPNSVCWEKGAESQLVEYGFNGCGHRAGMDCGPKVPGTYRIVMTGSSVAGGYMVRWERTFAALLPSELSRQTGRKIELYNEGMQFKTPRFVALRYKEVLAAQPDAILWILTPRDFEDIVQGPRVATAPGIQHPVRYRLKQALAKKSVSDAISDVLSSIREGLGNRWMDTASGILVRSCLYQNRSEYVSLYLRGGLQAEFLRERSDPEWQDLLQRFDRYAAEFGGAARAAGVPLLVVLVPNRVQAAMIAMGEWQEGYDPYKLGEELRDIVTSHGGTYIDILPDYREIVEPEQAYFPVDGHPNERGHAIISELLAKAIARSVFPPLRVAAQQSR